MKKNHLVGLMVCFCLLWMTGCAGEPEQTTTLGTVAMQSTPAGTASATTGLGVSVSPEAVQPPIKPSLEQLIDLTGKSDEELVAALGPGEVIKSENAKQINGRTYRVSLWDRTYDMTTTVNELGSVVAISIWMENGVDYDRAVKSVSAAMQTNPEKEQSGEDITSSWKKGKVHVELAENAGTVVLTLDQVEK